TVIQDGLVAAGRDNPGGHKLVVGLATDRMRRWRWDAPDRSRLAAFTVAGDQVLVASDVEDTTIQAIDRRTGGNLWTRTLNGQGQMIPVVAVETLYMGGSEFGVVALDTAN